MDGHSSGPAVANRLLQPTRTCWGKSGPGRERPRDPYLVLLPVGLAMPALLPAPRWALTPPFHPDLCGHRRSVFCGAFPLVTQAGRYPAPLLFGVRTFLTRLRRCGRPAIRKACAIAPFDRIGQARALRFSKAAKISPNATPVPIATVRSASTVRDSVSNNRNWSLFLADR